MNLFAVTAGVQIGTYLLLALTSWRWHRRLATLVFLLMAGRAVSDLMLFLELRQFPAGVLGTYDVALFPMIILVGWIFEIGWTRWYRWCHHHGKLPWMKTRKLS